MKIKSILTIHQQRPGATARFCAFKPVEADIGMSAGGALENRAFDARVLSTRGCTDGALSILTGAGKAFGGDRREHAPAGNVALYIAVGVSASFYIGIGTPMAIVIEIRDLNFPGSPKSRGAKGLYPARGRPFEAAEWMKKAPCQTRQRGKQGRQIRAALYLQ